MCLIDLEAKSKAVGGGGGGEGGRGKGNWFATNIASAIPLRALN